MVSVTEKIAVFKKDINFLDTCLKKCSTYERSKNEHLFYNLKYTTYSDDYRTSYLLITRRSNVFFKSLCLKTNIIPMDNQDIRTLKLLEEIENDHTSSQRDLSRKLNISLGLVNAFIRRLANKGYFKITTIPKNRARYILTPKGAAEKTRLTYEYIRYSFQYYKETRKRITDIFKDLESRGALRIVFYGKSELAEIAYMSLMETSITLVAIVDDLKIGERFMKRRVIAPNELKWLSFDRVLITILESREAVIKKILDNGIPHNKVVDV